MMRKPWFPILDSLVKWCRAENIYLILDMHCAPGGQTGDNIDDGYGYPYLFEDTASQKPNHQYLEKNCGALQQRANLLWAMIY